MPIWFPSIWGLIRIRNLLSVLYFNVRTLYQSAECESADSTFWGSIWPMGPTRLSTKIISHASPFSIAAVLSYFFAAFCGYWLTRKAPLLVLKNTPNAFRVFLKCSNGFHYTPRRFHSGTLCPSILKKLFESYLFFYPLFPHVFVLRRFLKSSLLFCKAFTKISFSQRKVLLVWICFIAASILPACF